MTLTLSLPPALEERLKDEAARVGVDASEYTVRLLEQHLLSSGPKADNATLKLFAKWDAEDATNDPAEIATRQQEWEALKQGLNENHSSNRKLFP